MENRENYSIIKSTLQNHHEVVVSYNDANNKLAHKVIFIKDKKGEGEAYYINEARKEFKSKYKINVSKKKPKKIKKKTLLIALASLTLVAATATGVTLGVVLSGSGTVQPEKDKFDKMHDYYKDYLIRTTNIDNYKDLTAEQILERGVYWKTVKVEGVETKIYTKLIEKKMAGVDTYYMKDIDYEDGSDRDSWPAASHVSQMKAIAIAATVKNDPKIMDIAVKMTYYWVYNNFRNTNWWHNDLGAGANDLANVGIFVYDYLNSLGKSMLVSKVARASFYYRPSLLTHAGTNLFDYADITLRSSIFTKNEEEFRTVINRIEEEITDRHLEGFQKDGSFFQHGQQVQIASYGKGVIRLAKVLKAISMSGTKFDSNKMYIIQRYLLTGLRNMTHRGYLNYSAVSREYVRKNNLSAKENNFAQFGEYLDINEFEGKEGLKAYLDSITDKKPCADELTYFQRAKMITLNLDGLYMSFKGTDSYLTNTECVNEENKLGLNLSYGTNTCVMDDGDEYHNISPLWNYAYVPGTTSIQLTKTGEESFEFTKPETVDDTITEDIVHKIYGDELYERQLDSANAANGFVYNGAIYPNNTNAQTEVAVLMQRSEHHDENKFTVTCIASKDGMLLLGADLTYTGKETSGESGSNKPFVTGSRKLHTTLEQCFDKGDGKVILDDNNTKLTHGKAVYKIINVEGSTEPSKEIKLERHKITESNGWGRNRKPTATEKADDLKAEGNVLLAYIDHNTATNASYAYSIQPQSLATTKDFKVYNNFDKQDGIQEIELPDEKHTTVIVCYKDTASYTDHNGYVWEPTEEGEDYGLKKGDIKIYDEPPHR